MKSNIFLGVVIAMILIFSATLMLLFYIQTAPEASAINVSSENGDNTGTSDSSQNIGTAIPTKNIQTTRNSEDSLKIIAVGDILLGRSVKTKVEAQKDRYLYPFEKVAGIMNKGDVVFGNLEESITSSTKSLTGIHEGGKYVLKNEVEAIKGIKYSGLNLLSLANNHILDYYEKGLFDTIKILDKNNIGHAGAGKNIAEARKPAIVEKKGLKIGLLAYTDMAYITYKGNPKLSFYADTNKAGVAPTREEYILQDIAKARGKVDILIVSLHWGVEDSFNATSEQIKFAHKLIDNGVDIILGHHPHHYQGIEIYMGKPIV
jgi:poly-gamma-glutamate synthesis protein (capsule biosynthesis protein)